MPFEAADFLAACGIPEPDCPIAAAGEQRGAVRGEGDAFDSTEESTSMSLETADFLAGCDVPKLGSPLITTGKYRGAAGSEGDA